MRFSLAVAFGLCCLPGFSFVLGQVFLLAGGRLSFVPAILIILTTLGLVLAMVWRLSRSWSAPAAVLAIVVVAGLACGVIYDTSFDGQQYHYDAVASLSQGWNPYRDAVPTNADVAVVGALAPWVSHYPAGAWISAAVQVAAGIPLEATKSHALLMLAGLLFVVFGAAREFGVTPMKAAVLALLAAANPVLLVQLFTRMNDGLLSASLALMVVFAMIWVLKRERWAMIPAIALLLFALNLKFSAVLIGAFFCAIVCGLALWLRGWRRALQVGSVLLATGAAGILLVGAHPYVTNTVGHGNPFYPLMGDSPLDIVSSNVPPLLEQLNPVERLGVSYFGATANGYNPPDERIKPPLMLYPSELTYAGMFDTRIAGFGPLFSAALTLGIVLAAVMLLARGRTQTTSLMLVTAGAFVVLGLILPEPWWARYVSQVWWSPALVAGAALMADGRRLRVAGWVLVGVMAANAGLVVLSAAKYVGQRNLDVRSQIAEMGRAPGKLCLYVGEMHARLALLGDLKQSLRIEGQPLQGCEVVPLAAGFNQTPAGYCSCP